MGFKQHISRTWQMIEQQVNDVPFRPDNEAVRLIKTPCLCDSSGIKKIKLILFRLLLDHLKNKTKKEDHFYWSSFGSFS